VLTKQDFLIPLEVSLAPQLRGESVRPRRGYF